MRWNFILVLCRFQTLHCSCLLLPRLFVEGGLLLHCFFVIFFRFAQMFRFHRVLWDSLEEQEFKEWQSKPAARSNQSLLLWIFGLGFCCHFSDWLLSWEPVKVFNRNTRMSSNRLPFIVSRSDYLLQTIIRGVQIVCNTGYVLWLIALNFLVFRSWHGVSSSSNLSRYIFRFSIITRMEQLLQLINLLVIDQV